MQRCTSLTVGQADICSSAKQKLDAANVAGLYRDVQWSRTDFVRALYINLPLIRRYATIEQGLEFPQIAFTKSLE